jgi:hypothetical protein
MGHGSLESGAGIHREKESAILFVVVSPVRGNVMFLALRPPRTAFEPNRPAADATRARRLRCELFLFAEETGDGFLFLLENASYVGGDIRIPGCSNDAHGHTTLVSGSLV